MEQNQELADACLRVAEEFLGEQEKTGQNDGPFVETIEGLFYGDDGTERAPWCAIFRWFVHRIASLALDINPLMPKTDSSTDLFGWAKENGALLDHPIPGCIGLKRGTGGDPSKTHCHTFRVISVDTEAGVVHSVDGNESNRVEHAEHDIDECDFVVCC